MHLLQAEQVSMQPLVDGAFEPFFSYLCMLGDFLTMVGCMAAQHTDGSETVGTQPRFALLLRMSATAIKTAWLGDLAASGCSS